MTLTMEQERLVLDNTKFVHYIARKYYHENLSHEDLASVGMIGLINASKRFDKSRGYKFITYATLHIRGEILKSFRKPHLETVSLNELVKTSEDTERVELIASNVSIEHEIQMKFDISHALSKLNERECEIIIRRYGLRGNDPLSQSQTGEYLNLSQMSISRIEKTALVKLGRILGR